MHWKTAVTLYPVPFSFKNFTYRPTSVSTFEGRVKPALPSAPYYIIDMLRKLIIINILKEEKTPIAMSTNSFPDIVNFLGV
jgi:hypothetical protein